jgi:hypothetical protein
MIDIARDILREEIPFIGTYDWVQVGIFRGGTVSHIGTITDIDGMLSPHGWIKEHLESVACSHCKELPGICTCGVIFDPARGGYVGRYWEVEDNV